MIYSRITTKSQTTIPRAVRIALGVGPGDSIAYSIEGNKVELKRLPVPERDMFLGNVLAFTEWADELDSGYDAL